MSNEVGNYLYKLAVQSIHKLANTKSTKLLYDYVVDKSVITQIFNISDYVITSYNRLSKDNQQSNYSDFMNEVTGIELSDTGRFDDVIYKTTYTPYLDDLFVYSKNPYPNHTDYRAVLLHRLDDDRVISFFFIINGDRVVLSGSCPITVTLNGVRVDMKNLALDLFDEKEDKEADATARAMLRECGFVYGHILKVFKDITDQNNRNCKCYVYAEDKKYNYFRKSTKEVIKAPEKPILIILKDDKDINNKLVEYKCKGIKLEYAFSWVVRGHYRRLHNPNTVGYNRNGEKVMQGMTWVDTYLKGDPNMPLLKRETIVIDKRKSA